jgi:hypothetical protein
MNGSLGRREWLGGPEATSTRGKHLTGKAFATRVRRINGHLNDKISHIRSESRNIVTRAELTVRQGSQRVCTLRKETYSDEGHGFSRAVKSAVIEGFSP